MVYTGHMLTKQTFIATAAVIRASVDARESEESPDHFEDGAGIEAILEIANGLCVMFERHNPRFKRDTFLTACGLSRMVEA